jgi:hypothetical protein
MTMDLTLRTQPLPTLPERRRMFRERLARTEADLAQLTRLLTAGPHSASRAVSRLRQRAKTAAFEVDQLTKAIAYLGEPDERLDLYRLFGMDLPTDEIPG